MITFTKIFGFETVNLAKNQMNFKPNRTEMTIIEFGKCQNDKLIILI